VTVVSPGSYIFSGTLRAALLEGAPGASEGAMLAALERVRLLDFALSRGGLDMPVTEGGGNLSGGQRQRLALARALLKDSPVYIFDEATSNIDAESEAAILRVIYSLQADHLVVLISHQLANVRDAGEIFFLRKGVLTERGSHAALLARQGGYARLYHAQRRLEDVRKEERLWAKTI
jgi:ABC-type multidrug transport system fused ATPase/permease subunit